MLFIFKFLGAFLGFRLGGLRGVVLGLLLGHALDAGLSTFFARWRLQNQWKRKHLREVKDSFLVCLFSLLARIATSDGMVKESEREMAKTIAREALKLRWYQRRRAMIVFERIVTEQVGAPNIKKTFVTSKHPPFHFLAAQLLQMCASQPETLKVAYELFLQMAKVDGPLQEQERQLLHAAEVIFNLSPPKQSVVKEQSVSEPDCYEILGCKKGDSFEVVKRKYRKLVSAYHPDKILGKSVPDELVSLASQKFQQIQKAYETIRKMHSYH